MTDTLVEIGNAIWAWFGNEDNRSQAAALATVVATFLAALSALAGAVWALLRLFFPKRRDAQHPLPTGDVLTIDQHVSILRKREAQLEDKLVEAHQEEKDLLQRQMAELQTQIADPEKSVAEARRRIADLETLLDRESNHIGGDRIKAAKTALEQGDYSLADNIFAEIEARNELAVQETARAAYGRGEVAEAEIRWHDAYTHYRRAAELVPTTDNLRKASEYAERAGHYEIAARFSRDFVELARDGDDQELLSTALNEHAINSRNLGRNEEAEGLYREALEIDSATIGEGHPDYAIGLNNLAGVVQAQGRHAEAEGLYREALKIGRATIGEGHPEYAGRLSNLASVVQEQGRYEEAEGFYREALEITRAALGEGHPDYAIRLSNLGQLLGQTGRAGEGRAMLERALAIFEDALPPDHPHIAEAKRRLAALPAD